LAISTNFRQKIGAFIKILQSFFGIKWQQILAKNAHFIANSFAKIF
jgi:hypothetical protein